MDPVVLDRIIERLLEVRKDRPGKLVRLEEAEIRQLCVVSREIFLGQPNLLELEAPIKICGYSHGHTGRNGHLHTTCVLCKESEEDIDHLFCCCPITRYGSGCNRPSSTLLQQRDYGSHYRPYADGEDGDGGDHG